MCNIHDKGKYNFSISGHWLESEASNIFEAKFYFIFGFTFIFFLSPLIFGTDFNICFITIAVNDMNNNS